MLSRSDLRAHSVPRCALTRRMWQYRVFWPSFGLHSYPITDVIFQEGLKLSTFVPRVEIGVRIVKIDDPAVCNKTHISVAHEHLPKYVDAVIFGQSV